jgi:DHA1 family tetracycline resistance protein-like MFS transporter
MLAAMLATAALFLAYLLPLPVTAFIAVRTLQGAAQGAYYPAANGLVAQVTAPADRGRAYGYLQSTNVAGMVIAPAIGGFIALFNLGIVFTVAAAFSVVAMAALALLPNAHLRPAGEAPVKALRIARRILPLILLGAGTAYMIGTFDTIWPLYMTYRGATTLAVGISFVTFALPATLLSGQAGALGDRFGPRRFIVIALLCTAFFAALYPFITSVGWLIGLGLVEGAFTISGTPALMAEVSRSAEPGHEARTQGVYQTVQTLVEIVGALAGGALFTLQPTYSFLAITVVCILSAGTALAPRVQIARQARQTP